MTLYDIEAEGSRVEKILHELVKGGKNGRMGQVLLSRL